MAVDESLATTHPDLAAQWHPTMNPGLSPDDVDTSHTGDVWWVCLVGHEFRAQLSSRARYGTGCPVCANKRVRPGVNDLASLASELAAEWHPSRNGDMTPEVVAPGYKGPVWWLLSCGHWFERSPSQRRADPRCPVCVDKRVYPGQNDLATLRPDLAAELAPGQDASQIRASSTAARVEWVRACGHTYTASPADRVNAGAPPCRQCAEPRKVDRAGLPMVADVPALLTLWDSDANAGLDPAQVKAGDNRTLIWWRCQQGHRWQRRPRTQKENCGVCAGKELLAGVTDLATVAPGLAAEWHPTKNGDLGPGDVLPQSNRKVWWLGLCGHEWEAKVANRFRGSGCPARC